jgi:hypothetical protein
MQDASAATPPDRAASKTLNTSESSHPPPGVKDAHEAAEPATMDTDADNEEELFCICRQPWNEDGPMMMCVDTTKSRQAWLAYGTV